MQDRHAIDPDQPRAERPDAEDRPIRRVELFTGRVLLAAVVISELVCLAVVATIVL